MTHGDKLGVPLRLCAVVALLVYLFAGASFALPSAPACARCAKMSNGSVTQPGASCPLSSRGHHCHNDQGQTVSKIVLCPDGCMHHGSTGGEIPSLVKFLSAPRSNPVPLLQVNPVTLQSQRLPLEPFCSPPDHPPSVFRYANS